MRIEMNRRDEDGVSLSEDERKELEQLRADKKAKEIWREAILTRGLLSSLTFGWTVSHFTPDNPFWRIITVVGSIVCMGLGILSSYYGPFKEKKEVKGAV